MAHRIGDRARETSTAPGSGSFTVNGAVQGAQSLASVMTVNADTAWYFATNGTAWEVGLLTRTSSTVYARTTIYASSNSGSAVNFSSGLVDIALDLPASLIETLNLTEITVLSATTTDIGAVQGAKIVISGTTTITGLGTSTNKLRFVRFSGALTLTYNATSLILPGAANIVTVAGDTAIFTSDSSGNWTCRSYNRGTLVPIDGAAWTTWSPTVTSSGGTITTVGTVVATYKQVGKTVVFRVKVPITTIGTASGRMIITLPVNDVGAAGSGSLTGFNGTNIKAVAGIVNFDAGNKASCALYDGTFPAGSGETVYLAGFYEAA